MTKYKIVLSEQGKQIFKGGNKEILKIPLNQIIEVKYKNKIVERDQALTILYNYIAVLLGSASYHYYNVQELKGGLKR